ncbi:MAG TPA: isoprenylcysteine carboxylmethyltransferase family protein, partial [Coriobacteriia bacterium]|nr:isoprenylcysteine carboxylmethyltransferase family protein [Coriobacteriia bacterium]
MSRLELRVPPDVVWIAVAALMWLVSTVTPGLASPGLVRSALAAPLFAAGIALIVAARVALDRAHTTWL